MVGMVMRHDQAGQALALERARKQRLPCILRQVVGNPGIDRCISVAVLDQIDVHMVQPEGQCQPRPQDARCDLDAGAALGWCGEGKGYGAGGGGGDCSFGCGRMGHGHACFLLVFSTESAVIGRCMASPKRGLSS